MSQSAEQKLRLLHIERLLLERTDEENPITVQRNIKVLAAMGITAERKTIYDDIEALIRIDMDIITVHSSINYYYVGERDFELPEVMMLVDMVQSARFITPAKSAKLISKLTALASRAQAQKLKRQVHLSDQAKTGNERIYYSLDAIHKALTTDRQISFRYFEWTVDKSFPRFFGKLHQTGDHDYRLSPWAPVWQDNNYYLIGYDSVEKKAEHYRVDQLGEVSVLDEAREGGDPLKRFGVGRYMRMTFGMAGGTPTNMRLRFANRLIGDVFEQFGDTISIHPTGDDHFIVNVEVAISPKFTSWLLGFGEDAELLSPQPLRNQLRQLLECLSELYRNPKICRQHKPDKI